ncbi:hypothetical protein [Actinoplanes rectilineatus]|uniref:hypothetical protein n=1 Tax=Actinoplanes rectilineatus TaxID=113571 RepID=UPI0005F2C8AE|nr:hypothetical protein [Actinoplanes rectilineatus]
MAGKPALLRSRGVAITAGAVALIAAVVTALVLNSGPAAATWKTLNGTPTCDCVLKNSEDNTYRAVFGYTVGGSVTGTIAAGDNNQVTLAGGTTTTEADVTTKFKPGTHKASFATGWVSATTTVTWKVGGKSVSATWKRPTCGNDVSLPAGGNGSGPLIVLAFAGVAAVVVTVWRRRRAAAGPR